MNWDQFEQSHSKILDPIFFTFMKFLAKFGQIIGCPPLRGNSGSATGQGRYLLLKTYGFFRAWMVKSFAYFTILSRRVKTFIGNWIVNNVSPIFNLTSHTPYSYFTYVGLGPINSNCIHKPFIKLLSVYLNHSLILPLSSISRGAIFSVWKQVGLCGLR